MNAGLSNILVIRGGGIGDFILTLPAIRLLREAFPAAHLELMSYRRVLGLAREFGYADRTRPIDWAPMASLFNPRAQPEPDIAEYLRDFDAILSYVYDPDGLFAASLAGLDARGLVSGDPHPRGDIHAAAHFARPLAAFDIAVPESPVPLLRMGRTEQSGATPDRVAIHPGSGGEVKNWPMRGWIEFTECLLADGSGITVVGGEADTPRLTQLAEHFADRIEILKDLPLEDLALRLSASAAFVGHDSGITHLAAAAGIPTLALFGPTDPNVWAPPRARVLQAPDRNLANLPVVVVCEALAGILGTPDTNSSHP